MFKAFFTLKRSRVLGAIALILCVTALGAVGGGAYGTLCGAIHGLIYWTAARMITWGIRGAISGAVAGAIVGVCWAIDRALDKSTPPTQSDAKEGVSSAGPKPRGTKTPEKDQVSQNGATLPAEDRAFCKPEWAESPKGGVAPLLPVAAAQPRR